MTSDEIYKLIEANGLTLHGDIEHFAHLVAERDYERGFVDGMQHQMQSSVDKAVNAMTQPTYYIPNKDEREWVGLTRMELIKCGVFPWGMSYKLYEAIEAKLKEKNCA